MPNDFIPPSMFHQPAPIRQQRSFRLSAICCLALASGTPSYAQTTTSAMPPPLPQIVFVCPLDRSIRSLAPGECAARGEQAELVAEVPELIEFPVTLTSNPESLRPDEPAQLRFVVRDPWEGKVVTKFTPVHESLLHVFLVSEDLAYFLHDHPRWDGDGFDLPVKLPRAGHYRVLADFLPEAATPQLAVESLFVTGGRMPKPALGADLSAKQTENLRVELEVMPEVPVAGTTSSLRFSVAPETGLELYVGAPAHLFVASDDLIDLIHAHPLATVPSSTVSFSVVFPRARTHRLWVQLQRDGVVNTARFDIPVRSAAP